MQATRYKAELHDRVPALISLWVVVTVYVKGVLVCGFASAIAAGGPTCVLQTCSLVMLHICDT